MTWPNAASLAEKDDKGFFHLKVSKKEKINHDTYEYVLDFPDAEWTSGVWAGGHLQWQSEIDGKAVMKPYTVVSPVN